MKEEILRIEKQKKFIIQFLYWGIIIGGCILLGKYLIPVLVPFIIAFIVAGVLNKPIQYISEKTRIKRKIVSVIVLLLFLFCSSIVVSYFCSLCFGMVERAVSFLPTLFESVIIPFTEQAFEKVEEIFHHADLSVLDVLQANASTVLGSMNHAVREFSNSILSSLANVISAVPTLFMQTIITIIAMFFITIDFNKIIGFIKRQIPETKKKIVSEAKSYFINTLPRVILSYGVVLGLTFLELWTGFLLLKIPYASLLALLIAILDILPILGTGTILIPWGILNLITGKYTLAAGIFILYVVITIIRNIVEPKLIGKQMELHPVLTLASMLTGLKFFGIWGLFGLPIVVSFLKKMNTNGTIHIFK